jgi:hypothetical protein
MYRLQPGTSALVNSRYDSMRSRKSVVEPRPCVAWRFTNSFLLNAEHMELDPRCDCCITARTDRKKGSQVFPEAFHFHRFPQLISSIPPLKRLQTTKLKDCFGAYAQFGYLFIFVLYFTSFRYCIDSVLYVLILGEDLFLLRNIRILTLFQILAKIYHPRK